MEFGSIYVLESLDLAKAIPNWVWIQQEGIYQHNGKLVPCYRVIFALDEKAYSTWIERIGRQVQTWEVSN